MDLLTRTLESLDWPFLTNELAACARTGAGRTAARDVVLLEDAAAIVESFDAIDELSALRERRAGWPPLGGIEEIGEALERAARGDVLELAEIRDVRSTTGTLVQLRRFLDDTGSAAPALARLGEPVRLERELWAGFEAALDERGELSEATYPLLGQLRARIAALEQRVRAVLEDLLDAPEYAQVLQDRYVTVRDDRFVLPIMVHAKGLGLGIVHDVSRSGQTVFVEPLQLVPLGNDKRIAEAELRDEERRIRADLSSLLGRHAGDVRAALAAATALDLACARAGFAQRLAATRPAVATDSVIDLRVARHPVLALTQQGVVPNDLAVSATRPVLVLTGPNAGGKTVAMKTVALCALLVRAGCFVPAAAGSRVDVFARILADIGDMQTVHEGVSSFSAHLTTLRSMLEQAGPAALLLLDEIAAGTDPAQGGALARAVIERLADVGARVVVTTHYAQVKSMGADDRRVEVSALEYRDGRPTYRVVPGTAGESHALAAATRVGIDDALVERARALMDAADRALHEALAALEAEKERARQAAERTDRANAELERRGRALAERERTLEEREQRIRGNVREIERREARQFVDRLRAAEQEVRRILAELQAAPSRERAAAARAALEQARAAADDVRRSGSAPLPQPRVGDRVRLPELGTIGEVTALRGGEVEVRAGLITVRAAPDDVEMLDRAGEPSRAADSSRGRARGPAAAYGAATRGGRPPSPHASETRPPDPVAGPALERAVRVPDNTLDLRGLRVEEALARLETFLDESMIRNRDFVFVLHGHGTGALRSAIRRALAASRYVAASAAAAEEQGGEAFSVARLRG